MAQLSKHRFVLIYARTGNYLFASLTLLVLLGCSQSASTSPMDICVDAAKKILEKFDLSNRQFQNKCECVKTKSGGELPSKSAQWLVWGERSTKLLLLECAAPEVIANFKKQIDAEVSPTLKKRGFTDRRVNDYSTCGAQAIYEAKRRQIAEPDGIESDINKKWFDQQNKNCLDAGG